MEKALENAKQILGEAGCTQVLENAPIDWADVQRGRDMFVPGWGGFDIAAALDLCNSSGVPSVEELRSSGYLLKYFSDLTDPVIRGKIQRLLRTPESLLARYMVQHRSFWADARNANRVDEIETYWLDFQRPDPARALKEDPKKLLNRLARDRLVAQYPLVQFQHLQNESVFFFNEDSQILSPSESESWSYELSVLKDSHSVLRAARELNNCAADYIRNLRQKRCALLVLRSPKRLLAMGEWDLHSRRWSQISEHSDEPVRDAWLCMYQRIADNLFPVRTVLPVPELEVGTGLLQEVREDRISIFSAEGASDLEDMCNTSFFGMQPCFGWPSMVPTEYHPEACGALLLWTVAGANSNEIDLEEDIEEIVDQLLCKRADPDSMTDCGWNSLMFAVMAQRNTIVARLLEAAADIDARAVHSGRTALMLASSTQNFGIVCRLVTAAASLDFAARIDGRTAILQAVHHSAEGALTRVSVMRET